MTITIKPKRCGKCGKEYTPVINSDDCPHNEMTMKEKQADRLDRPDVCHECSGTGRTILVVGYQGNDPYMGKSKCPTCKGTGKITKTIREIVEEWKR